jgi:integrase
VARRARQGDGSIVCEGSKRWVAQIMVDGRRMRRVRRTKEDARTALKALRAELDAGVVATDTTLGEWLQHCLRDVWADKDPNTLDSYRWAVNQWKALFHKRLRDLTVPMIDRHLVQLAADGRVRSSLVRARNTLVNALFHAQRTGGLSKNVASFAIIPPRARKAPPRRSLDADQAKALLEVAPRHRLGNMFTLGLYTGLRPGELAGLRWADVDLDEGVIHVRQARRRMPDGELVLGETKTPRSRRSIALAPQAVEALRAQRRSQAKDRLRAGWAWSDLDLVFANEIGGLLDPSNDRRALDEMCKDAGIPHFSPNELRHSAASHLLNEGVLLEVVADQLGHATTRMLDQVYRHRVRPVIDTSSAAARMFEAEAHERKESS